MNIMNCHMLAWLLNVTKLTIMNFFWDQMWLIHPRSFFTYGFPFADSSEVASYFVSAVASRSHKVVLTGDGGIESFGGYSKQNLLFSRALETLPDRLIRVVGNLSPLQRSKRLLNMR